MVQRDLRQNTSILDFNLFSYLVSAAEVEYNYIRLRLNLVQSFVSQQVQVKNKVKFLLHFIQYSLGKLKNRFVIKFK
jgi:hypothetical protein